MTPPGRISVPLSRVSLRNKLRSPEALAVLLWTLAALIVAGIAFKRLFTNDLVDADAMDYAQIARSIESGHGFSTGILRPLALSGFVSVSQGMTPDISHAPLYPLVLALTFLAHGGHGGAVVVVLTCLFLFLLNAVAAYFLARALLPVEGIPLALLAAGLYMLSGSALGFAMAGLPVTLATLTVTGLLITLHRAHEVAARPASPHSEVMVGVLLGLCFLTQYSLGILFLPTVLYIFASRAPARAWRGAGLCSLGFFLITAGWLVRMMHVTGNPFFTLRWYDLMANTPDYPGATGIYRGVLPSDSPFAYFFAHLPQMLVKAGQNLRFYQVHISEAFSVLVLTGAIGSLLWRFGDVRLRILRIYVALCLFLLVGGSVFFAPSVQILAPFAPVMCVLAVGFAVQLMRRQEWQALSLRVTLWAWGLLAGGSLLAFLVSPPPAINPVQQGVSMVVQPPLAQPLGDLVRRRIFAGSVLTDIPWELTWRTGLSAVWLPRDDQAYEAVIARLGGIGKDSAPALLLTPTIAVYSDGSPEGNAWVLFSTHPQAWTVQEQALADADHLPKQIAARAAQMRALITAHDPRITMTLPDLARQYAEARQTMPARIQRQKQHSQQDFVSNYGLIAEMVQDYVPAAAQSEANHINSTLFVQRDILRP